MSERNLKDAFYGANFKVGQGLLTRDKSTDSNDLTEETFENIQTWDELTDETDTDEAFDELTESFQACKDMAGSKVAIKNVLDKNDTAFDLLTDKEAGMDGVTEVELGMDIITDRQDSMDKVTSKPMAFTKFLASQHILNIAWDKETGSQYLWGFANQPNADDFPKNGFEVLVEGYASDPCGGDGDSEDIRTTDESPSSYSNGKGLEIRGRGSGDGFDEIIYWYSRAVDLTDVDEIKIWNFDYTGGGNGGIVNLYEEGNTGDNEDIELDCNASNGSWTENTYDVSDLSGNYHIALGTENDDARSGDGDDDWEDGDVFFGLNLVKE